MNIESHADSVFGHDGRHYHGNSSGCGDRKKSHKTPIL